MATRLVIVLLAAAVCQQQVSCRLVRQDRGAAAGELYFNTSVTPLDPRGARMASRSVDSESDSRNWQVASLHCRNLHTGSRPRKLSQAPATATAGEQ